MQNLTQDPLRCEEQKRPKHTQTHTQEHQIYVIDPRLGLRLQNCCNFYYDSLLKELQVSKVSIPSYSATTRATYKCEIEIMCLRFLMYSQIPKIPPVVWTPIAGPQTSA
jgi:hypothetical protein